jgi:TorA maturation chaperone TorD
MSQPVHFVRTLAPEDQARANFYALLSRLFYAPPDAGFLAALASADDLEAEDEVLAKTWRELCAAAAGADPEALRDEYEMTFVGTGHAPITLYTSAYSLKYTNETPLVALRSELAELGLARRSDAGEPEDHLAALCDVMRHLIAEQQGELSIQKKFFERWIRPNMEPLCGAIERSELGAFYKGAGRLAKSFFLLEHSGFEML